MVGSGWCGGAASLGRRPLYHQPEVDDLVGLRYECKTWSRMTARTTSPGQSLVPESPQTNRRDSMLRSKTHDSLILPEPREAE